MQYILSQEEYDAFKQEQEIRHKIKERDLQKLCIKIADTMPIQRGWGQPDDPKPWGCIHTVKHEWYCDKCPVKDICPESFKHWSK